MPEAREAQQAQEARDGAAVREFVERFASLLADSGMPRMPARIFVALLTSDTSRLTAEELAEIREAGDRIMLGATWETQDGARGESAERFFQVVTMRDGKIIDIQGCKSRRDALKRLSIKRA